MDRLNEDDIASFQFTWTGPMSELTPSLLGRAIRYVLNIKALSQDGRVLAGKRYMLNSDHQARHQIDFEGAGREQTSSAGGNSFLIVGKPATSSDEYDDMNSLFTIRCDPYTGDPSTDVRMQMGRLAKWGMPRIMAGDEPGTVVFRTKTEWQGESYPDAMWGWGDNVSSGSITIGTVKKTGTVTLPDENGSVVCDHVFDSAQFSGMRKEKVTVPGAVAEDFYTAVLPFEEELELYYLQKVEFKGQVYIDTEATVECVLTYLDGTPKAGVEISWTTNFGELLDVRSVTDEKGIAQAHFKSVTVGDVVVTATAAQRDIYQETEVMAVQHHTLIVNQEASAEEYIIDFSDPVKFSVWVKKGETTPSGIQIEWSVDKGDPVESSTDSTGMAFYDLTFKEGEHKVKATVKGTPHYVEFSMVARVAVVEISEYRASATEYVIGDPEPVMFSVLLTKGGKTLPATLVEWFIGGHKKYESYSNESGRAVCSATHFVSGKNSVVAKVGTSVSEEKFVNATYGVVNFEAVVASDASYLSEELPNVLSRDSTYTLRVKVVNSFGINVPGIKFLLQSTPSDPKGVGVSIPDLGVPITSGDAEYVFYLIPSAWKDKEVIVLSLTSEGVSTWSEAYRLGWVYYLSLVTYMPNLRVFSVNWINFLDRRFYDGEDLELGVITATVPSRNLECDVIATHYQDIYPVGIGGIPKDGPEPVVFDLVHVPRYVGWDGYVVLRGGTVPLVLLGIPSDSQSSD